MLSRKVELQWTHLLHSPYWGVKKEKQVNETLPCTHATCCTHIWSGQTYIYSEISQKLCVSRSSSLQTTESFLTSVKKKKEWSERILLCSLTLCKGQWFILYSLLSSSLSAVSLSRLLPINNKKSVFELLTMILLLIEFVLLEQLLNAKSKGKLFKVSPLQTSCFILLIYFCHVVFR